MDIGCTNLRLIGLQTTSEFHVKFHLRFVIGQLCHVGFTLQRILVSICNTRNVHIGVIAEDLVDTYDQIYTEQFVEDLTDRFASDFGVSIARLIPMPIRNGNTFDDQEYITQLYNIYTKKMDSLLDPNPPLQNDVAASNYLPVVPQHPVPDHHSIDLTDSIPFPVNPAPLEHAVAVPNSLPDPPSVPVFNDVATRNTLSDAPVNDLMSCYRNILKKINRIEYDTTQTVGLCLLDTIEFMTPVYKNRLNILIYNKMSENTTESYSWLFAKSKFRSTRYGGDYNNTTIVNNQFMLDWANDYRNGDDNWQNCIIDHQLVAIAAQTIIHILRIDSIGNESFYVNSGVTEYSPPPGPHLYTCYPYWDTTTTRNDCSHINSGLVVDDEDIVLIYHNDSFFCTRSLNQIEDENSILSLSPPSPDSCPPSPDVEDTPSTDIQDILPTTSQGPPVNSSTLSSRNEEDKKYLDISSDNCRVQSMATNEKE